VHLFHFGPPEAPLAGQFEPAVPPRRHRPVLLLHPGGWEYLRAYRTMRQLSARLAAAGCDVLRFDYTGTGDSWGHTADRPVAAWLGDVAQAAEELEALAGHPTAIVIGLRLGARLALEAVAKGLLDAERIVLWDPVDGAGPFDAGVTGDRVDSALALRAAIDGRLRGIEAPEVHALLRSRRVEVVLSAGVVPPTDMGVASDLPLRLPADDPPCWREERTWGAGALPVGALATIVQRCTA
jgi:pimeloyl-ACP methyl ester carboxylesterase